MGFGLFCLESLDILWLASPRIVGLFYAYSLLFYILHSSFLSYKTILYFQPHIPGFLTFAPHIVIALLRDRGIKLA